MVGITPGTVVPRPKGTITVKGKATTASKYEDTTWDPECAYTVTKDKIFKLAKITISCSEDVMAKVVFGEEDISIEYYVMAKLPFTDWFPCGYNFDKLKGDGTKQIKIQAKFPSGGKAATVFAELSGEEV